MNILEFHDSPELMGGAFAPETRQTMRAVLAGAWGLPMDDDALALFKSVTGDREPPPGRVRELWIAVGRRAEKTREAACIGLYLATVGAEIDGLKGKLAPGERGVVAIIAVDRDQAKIAMEYVKGLVEQSAVLSALVASSDTESLHFKNRVSIQVHTNSFRAVRGRTLLAVILDECAFFRSDFSANPDIETYRAALPGLATCNGMVIGVSSPYSRKGLLHDKHKRHFGQNDPDVLFVQGESRQFNPTIPEQLVRDALRDDPEAAKSEWLGQFRDDLQAFLSRDVVEGLVRSSPLELPFDSKHKYVAFTDPAGGGSDEFTLCICHKENDIAVVDMVRGLKGTPSAIVAEYAIILKAYKISEVRGDRYGGSWPADEFKKHGIKYAPSEKNKSEMYVDALPMFNSGALEIPNDQATINQLTNLERRTSRTGRDTVDHPIGGHDDRANVIAGAVLLAKKPRPVIVTNVRSYAL